MVFILFVLLNLKLNIWVIDIAIKEEPLDDIPPMEDVQIIAKMEPLDVDCNDISFFQNFVPYLNKLTSIQKARVYTKIHHLILEEIS